MPLILLCFMAALFGFAQADMSPLELMDACNKESGISKAELQEYFDSQMDPAKATNAIKCHMKCVSEKFGFYKSNMLDETVTIKYLNENNMAPKASVNTVKQSIQQCNQLKGANSCDTAFQIMSCFKSQPIFT
ncbi:PREDICTED: general odorant-binding protein 56h-like [Bactrocera latifrons]|uniref:general odorant-binding protein 56h-like n=1 Tax=Bactrocera latifrons TaxID=174628 RepID=UPI0008DEA58D|nr:PREDICTED: general odorant-binding protein 56h-like [Bactrocera latifrons]